MGRKGDVGMSPLISIIPFLYFTVRADTNVKYEFQLQFHIGSFIIPAGPAMHIGFLSPFLSPNALTV